MTTPAPRSGTTVRTPAGVIRPTTTVRAATRGDDTILVDLAKGRYFTLNAVGTRIWALLANGITFDELTTLLANEYDAPEDVIVDDAWRLLEQLRRAALIAWE